MKCSFCNVDTAKEIVIDKTGFGQEACATCTIYLLSHGYTRVGANGLQTASNPKCDACSKNPSNGFYEKVKYASYWLCDSCSPSWAAAGWALTVQPSKNIGYTLPSNSPWQYQIIGSGGGGAGNGGYPSYTIPEIPIEIKINLQCGPRCECGNPKNPKGQGHSHWCELYQKEF